MILLVDRQESHEGTHKSNDSDMIIITFCLKKSRFINFL